MAVFEMGFPADFMENLLQTDSEALCEEMLRESAPILEESMKKHISSVMGDYSTGEAAKSIKARKPKKARNGAYIVNVCPTGYSAHTYNAGKAGQRKYKVSNALKLIWKEYGIPGKQVPRPFVVKSVNGARNKVLQKMQEVYNRKAGADGTE